MGCLIHSDNYYASKDVIQSVVNKFNENKDIKAIYGVMDSIGQKTGKLKEK